MELHAKCDGTFRLTPPQGQAIASIRSLAGKPMAGKSMSVGRDGAIHVNQGATYVIAFR